MQTLTKKAIIKKAIPAALIVKSEPIKIEREQVQRGKSDWQHVVITEKSQRHNSEMTWLNQVLDNRLIYINPEYNETSPLFLENKAFDFVIDENNDIEINDKPVIRRPRTVIPDTNIIQLCEINLGYWRKYYDKKFDILFGKRVETPAADGKIIYTTIISCTPENKDKAIKILKDIANGTKIIFDWF